MTVSSATAEVGWGLERVWSNLRLAVPHFREESSRWQSLLQEGSSLTGWGVEDTGTAQNCTCLFYDLENNQIRRQKTFFLPSVQKDGEQFGLHQNAFRLQIKQHKLWHNYSITTKNLLVLRFPASNSARRSTVFSKSISSSEIMFLNLPHRSPIQDSEGCMRFTYRLFFSFN